MTVSPPHDGERSRHSGRLVAVVNAGSSSLKYELLADDGASIASGNVEQIGAEGGCPGYHVAVERALADLTSRVPNWRERVRAAAYRVVHGGAKLYRPTLIDDAVVDELERQTPFAPLHLPAALDAIRSARKLLAGVPHVAVFDTGFHHDLPLVAQTYAIPYELAERWAIRRYGAHGISCEYLAGRLRELDPERRRVILCHLGAGASVTAVLNGRSIDTSMGFTPLEGLAMATRSGDLDPAIVLFLQENAGLSVSDVGRILESESGLKGLSGVGGDFRTIEGRAADGDRRSRLAIDVFAYRVRKYIGAYGAALGGIDAVVFSGGIGENSSSLRAAVVGPLGALGLGLDPSANASGGSDRRISPTDAPVTVWVIPTRESLVIARHALAFAASS